MKNLTSLLNELNNELKEQEISLCGLDNFMLYYGINSAYNETNPYDVLEMESVSYCVDDNQWINILFDTINIDKDNDIDSIVKIIRVEEV